MLDAVAPLPETVAAVDLGSNSFHLIVARPSAGELIVVDRLREMVQLAAGLDEKRRIDPEAGERALDCLRRFGERLSHMPAETVRVVGTNTLRSARNASAFVTEAEEVLGHPIETISGIEEARLVYLGAAHSLPDPAARRLVVDIGGGSTEVIVGDGFDPIRMESLYVGCVSTSRRYFADGSIGAKSWRKAELAALSELEPLRNRFRAVGWDQAVGTSGTVRAVDAVIREHGLGKHGITPKALRRVRDAILEAGHVDDLDFTGVSARRRSVFPGGVALLMAAVETLGIERMDYAEGALREGLMYDLIGRIRREDVRGRSVSALGERYHVDWKQAERVERTALKLLAQAEKAWSLDGEEARLLLSWAARLHEIGLDIAHQHYHWHGEYILEQSDLLGFSREEQKLLATLVRAHRRKFPVSVTRALPRRRVKTVERLVILLRLAVVLHRSRSPDAGPEPGLAVSGKDVELSFDEGWLDARPLTRSDLRQERDYLEGAGYRLAFG